jgi:nucleotide-binding universal stress UspA family protein
MGDDTRAALNGAPCAIAIAPLGYTQTDQHLRTIGVGYDGGLESERALAAARELANRNGAAIKTMWVVTLENVRDETPIPADWPETTEVAVSHCRRELERLDGIEADATYGGPREELSRMSNRVDLLIVGSRGHGPIHRLFHGSTSSYLTRHSECSLLVLPRSTPSATSGATTDRAEPCLTAHS